MATAATFSRSAEPRMIRARAPCFCARLRSATIASSRVRSAAETRGADCLCHAPSMAHLPVEYLIFATLARARDARHLSFTYEQELVLLINGDEVNHSLLTPN